MRHEAPTRRGPTARPPRKPVAALQPSLAARDDDANDTRDAALSGLKLVEDNGEALAMRLLSAREATESLDLMYYLLRRDRSGSLLINEVVAAADRGVRVRMLIDDINPQRNDDTYLSLNSHPNIELRLFNPSGLRNGSLLRWLELVARMFAMTRRMHAKAWIVDRKVAIVGGRNIGDEYFGAAETNFRDLDLLMLGKAVGQTAAIFERYWASQESVPLEVLHPAGGGHGTERIRSVPPSADNPAERWTSLDAFIAEGLPMVWTPTAQVLADPPEKVRGRRETNWLMNQVAPKLREAKERLEIVSPYFIPGRKGSAIIEGLRRRGVAVTVLTNSLAATDVAAVHGAYANYRKRLLRAGVALHELRPSGRPRKMSVLGSKGASLHTKAFAVDGRTGFVGSMNFDPRSVSINAEMGVLFEDERLTGELVRHFERERQPDISYRLTLEGRRIRWNRADGEPKRRYGEPGASIGRRLLAFVVRWLPLESQL